MCQDYVSSGKIYVFFCLAVLHNTVGIAQNQTLVLFCPVCRRSHAHGYDARSSGAVLLLHLPLAPVLAPAHRVPSRAFPAPAVQAFAIDVTHENSQRNEDSVARVAGQGVFLLN